MSHEPSEFTASTEPVYQAVSKPILFVWYRALIRRPTRSCPLAIAAPCLRLPVHRAPGGQPAASARELGGEATSNLSKALSRFPFPSLPRLTPYSQRHPALLDVIALVVVGLAELLRRPHAVPLGVLLRLLELGTVVDVALVRLAQAAHPHAGEAAEDDEDHGDGHERELHDAHALLLDSRRSRPAAAAGGVGDGAVLALDLAIALERVADGARARGVPGARRVHSVLHHVALTALPLVQLGARPLLDVVAIEEPRASEAILVAHDAAPAGVSRGAAAAHAARQAPVPHVAGQPVPAARRVGALGAGARAALVVVTQLIAARALPSGAGGAAPRAPGGWGASHTVGDFSRASRPRCSLPLGPERLSGSYTVHGAATCLESQPQEARPASCDATGKALCKVVSLLVAGEVVLGTAARVRALPHRAGALRGRRRARWRGGARGEALVVLLAEDGGGLIARVHALGVPVVVLVAMEAVGDAAARRAALLPALRAVLSREQLVALPPCAVFPDLVDARVCLEALRVDARLRVATVLGRLAAARHDAVVEALPTQLPAGAHPIATVRTHRRWSWHGPTLCIGLVRTLEATEAFRLAAGRVGARAVVVSALGEDRRHAKERQGPLQRHVRRAQSPPRAVESLAGGGELLGGRW
eukprot:scaffold118224_cov67-Phaeocystis_antarctica.AAC.2